MMTSRIRHLFLAAIAGFLVVAVATVAVPHVSQQAEATTVSGSVYTFEGGGWGHGVGMSQYGAYGMALKGSSSDQIVRHYYTGTQITTRSSQDTIRVLLATKIPRFDMVSRGSVPVTQLGVTAQKDQGVVITASGNNLVVQGTAVGSPRTISSLSIPLSPANGGFKISQMGHRSYEYGTLIVTASNGTIEARLVMPMQHYLYGIQEMPASWPAAALQSQAMAARTYALRHVSSSVAKARSYDVDTTTTFQVYGGVGGQHPNWVAAVNATNNKVITHNGGLIDAVYFSSSGGYTAASETVWSAALPYLRAVPDPHDTMANNRNSNKIRTFTAQQLGTWFGVGSVKSITISGASVPDGRINNASFKLVGTTGQKTVPGITFRNTVNNNVSATDRFLGTRVILKGGTGAVVAPPKNTLPSGSITYAEANGRTITIRGKVSDPEGINNVRIISTMGRQRGVYNRTTNARGEFVVTWVGSPGTRNVCLTAFDNPTQQAVNLGCREVIVK